MLNKKPTKNAKKAGMNINGSGVANMNMIPEKQKEILRNNRCFISRSDTNKYLKEYDTGFSVTENETLHYNLSHLKSISSEDYSGFTHSVITNRHDNYFKNQIQVLPLLLTNGGDGDDTDDESNLDLRLYLRLTFLKDTNRIPDTDNSVVLDVCLHDLAQDGAFVRLLGIVYTLKSLDKSHIFGNCRIKDDIQAKVNELESEVLNDEYIKYISYQLGHANSVVDYTSGEFLDGLTDNNKKLGHVFMSDVKNLFFDTPIVPENMGMEYCVTPISAAYGVTFRNIRDDIEKYMGVLEIDTTGENDVPTSVLIPDMLWIGTMYNLLTIEWMLRHIEFLTKLKALKTMPEKTADWGETLFNYINLPQFAIPAALIASTTQSEQTEPLIVD